MENVECWGNGRGWRRRVVSSLRHWLQPRAATQCSAVRGTLTRSPVTCNRNVFAFSRYCGASRLPAKSYASLSSAGSTWPSPTRSQASSNLSPVRLMHRVTSGAVCAGKWRVCVDTTNLLGGPFQMVFTTNGIKQILDNVYVLTGLSAFHFSVTDVCSSSGSLATRHHPVRTTRSTQSRLLTPVRRSLIPLAGHRVLACTNPAPRHLRNHVLKSPA